MINGNFNVSFADRLVTESKGDQKNIRKPAGKESFVNLPVKNLDQSMNFFTRLAFAFNPQFTDETAACMIVEENIFVMLLTEEKFKVFTPKEICDAARSTEVLVCLSFESREKVDEIVRKAVAVGGTTYSEPQDHGFMYGHGFQDLDGHIWEVVFLESEEAT